MFRYEIKVIFLNKHQFDGNFIPVTPKITKDVTK